LCEQYWHSTPMSFLEGSSSAFFSSASAASAAASTSTGCRVSSGTVGLGMVILLRQFLHAAAFPASSSFSR
jgi:hypothetical protein